MYVNTFSLIVTMKTIKSDRYYSKLSEWKLFFEIWIVGNFFEKKNNHFLLLVSVRMYRPVPKIWNLNERANVCTYIHTNNIIYDQNVRRFIYECVLFSIFFLFLEKKICSCIHLIRTTPHDKKISLKLLPIKQYSLRFLSLSFYILIESN